MWRIDEQTRTDVEGMTIKKSLWSYYMLVEHFCISFFPTTHGYNFFSCDEKL